MYTLFIELFSTIQSSPTLALILVVFVSLCVGSFLNVVIYRTPLMMMESWREDCSSLLHPEQPLADLSKMTLSSPSSTCPKCGHRIKWFENIPIFSWLFLKGKCSQCKNPISIRYPLVELSTVLVSVVVFFVFGPTLKMVFALVFTWVLIALTGIDFDTQLLPDRFTLPLAGAGLFVNAFSIFVSPTQAIFGYVIGFLAFWIVYIVFKVITGKEGMGYGDFKLLAALGAWLGVEMIPLIILISSVVGCVIGVILLRVRKENAPFAFGPFIAIAGWIALVCGPQIVHAYLSMYH